MDFIIKSSLKYKFIDSLGNIHVPRDNSIIKNITKCFIKIKVDSHSLIKRNRLNNYEVHSFSENSLLLTTVIVTFMVYICFHVQKASN